MIYKNIKVKVPSNCVINSKGYVYLGIGRVYIKDRKYNLPSRVCIGKSISKDYMNPNEHYEEYFTIDDNLKEAPILSDTLSIGLSSVVDKILDDSQIDILLSDILSKEDEALIRDLIIYMIYSESTVIQHFNSVIRRIPIKSSVIRSDSYISSFFKDNISDKNIELFLDAWNSLNRKKDIVYLSYDSTNMNTYSSGIELAEYGHPKIDEGLPQVNLSLAINQKESLPLFYELYPGSISDVSQLKNMIDRLNEYGYKDLGIILDRGYFSKANIEYIRKHNFEYLLMVKTSNELISNLLEKYRYILPSDKYYIDNHDVYGTSIKTNIFKNEKAYIHLYFDSERAAYETKQLSRTRIMYSKELDEHIKSNHLKDDLKKYSKMFHLKANKQGYLISYSVNERYMKKESDTFGFFSIITSKEMSAKEALDIYRDRDTIEKLFESLKQELDYSKFRVSSNSSLKGKTFTTFLATIIRSRIYYQTKALRLKNRKDYTVPAIINELSNIEITKNAKDKYVRRYSLTSKQKNILNCFNITDKDIDESIKHINNH